MRGDTRIKRISSHRVPRKNLARTEDAGEVEMKGSGRWALRSHLCDGTTPSGSWCCKSAAGEETGEEVEEVGGGDDAVVVDVGGRGFAEEGGEEIEEVRRADLAVAVEVGGAEL